MKELTTLSAHDALEAIRRREIGSTELVEACLDRIRTLEPRVEAWTFLDPEHALAQARDRDQMMADRTPLGPLHGLPVGIKDIFDTADMPTENGTVLHAGRQPGEDATVVTLLRAAGAIILGKTVTTELAVYGPGKTKNPRNPDHTPGGSSSGSAAAVAAEMVPLAIGSQTNGSVIRPAAYCGVVGYKPTFGAIPRTGALRQSRPLDHVGVFARTVEDAALLAHVLMVFDDRDPDMRLQARPHFLETANQDPPSRPNLAFVKSPYWAEADETARTRLIDFAIRLECVEEVELPPAFAEAAMIHRTIMEADLASSFAAEYARGKERLTPTLRSMIERGQRTLAMEYRHAVERVPGLVQALESIFTQYDAILTPATTGEAPAGLASTGNPIFCTIWTLCGVPAVTLPLLRGPQGLPLGVQLAGRRHDDARLLRTARWLATAGR
ncbi:MAG: amidase [Zetaproteobacteria bacterium]|nr:MAG: amidase [Zetaproteobacteria bacterium]